MRPRTLLRLAVCSASAAAVLIQVTYGVAEAAIDAEAGPSQEPSVNSLITAV